MKKCKLILASFSTSPLGQKLHDLRIIIEIIAFIFIISLIGVVIISLLYLPMYLIQEKYLPCLTISCKVTQEYRVYMACSILLYVFIGLIVLVYRKRRGIYNLLVDTAQHIRNDLDKVDV